MHKKSTKLPNQEIETQKAKLKFEMKSVTEHKDDSGDEFYIVTGYATEFFGIDYYGDRIIPGAYQETIAKNDGFPAFVMHKSGDMAVGLFYELKEDSKGLIVRCRLPKDDTLVSGRLIPQIKTKSVDALSIGFSPIKFSFEEIDGETVRILEKIELREISFINKGYQADSGALLTDLKMKPEKTDDENYFNSMVESFKTGATDEVKEKIIKYYESKGKTSPYDDEAVLSVEELKSLSKSNLVYALRYLKPSAKAAGYLAELVMTPKSLEQGSEGEEMKQEEDSKKESLECVKNSLVELLNKL